MDNDSYTPTVAPKGAQDADSVTADAGDPNMSGYATTGGVLDWNAGACEPLNRADSEACPFGDASALEKRDSGGTHGYGPHLDGAAAGVPDRTEG